MRKRRRPRPQPDRALSLVPVTLDCPECQHRTQARYNNFRTVTTLDGVLHLTLSIRRCPNPDCPRFHRPYRPEAEPHFALPYHEFGLDVLALVGRLRHAEHRSVPEIHRELTRRGVVVAQRTVTNLLDRYDELGRLATADPKRLGPLLRQPASRRPGHRRLAARRRPRGPLGLARLPLRGGPPGQESPVVHRHGPAGLMTEVHDGPAGADHRRHLRRPGQHPQGGPEGPAGRAASAVPLPLSARGGPADLRGRSSCQEGIEEACPRHPPDRATGEQAERIRRMRRRRSCGATAPRCVPP